MHIILIHCLLNDIGTGMGTHIFGIDMYNLQVFNSKNRWVNIVLSIQTQNTNFEYNSVRNGVFEAIMLLLFYICFLDVINCLIHSKIFIPVSVASQGRRKFIESNQTSDNSFKVVDQEPYSVTLGFQFPKVEYL